MRPRYGMQNRVPSNRCSDGGQVAQALKTSAQLHFAELPNQFALVRFPKPGSGKRVRFNGQGGIPSKNGETVGVRSSNDAVPTYQ